MQDHTSASALPVEYTPGSWVAMVSGGVALLAELDPASPIARYCWDALDHGAGADGVLGVILREGLRSVPSFAIAAREAVGFRILVSGKARAEATVPDQPQPVLLSAAESPTWQERRLERSDGIRLIAAELGSDISGALPLVAGAVLAASLTMGAVAVGSARAEAGSAADVVADSTLQLPPVAPVAASGEATQVWQTLDVPAELPPPGQDGARLIDSLPWQLPQPAPPAPVQPVRQEPVPHYVAPQPPFAAPEANVPAQAEPPTVLATACPQRHLGPPHASVCRICGAPVPQQEPFRVPRPPLGVLRLSSGDMVPLDRDVVLGRAPAVEADTDPQTRPHLVQLASPGNDISRTHVRINLEGWHVQVVDLGSTNGTIVTLPGQQPVRLRSHDPFTIVAGTDVNIADEVHVRFEVSG